MKSLELRFHRVTRRYRLFSFFGPLIIGVYDRWKKGKFITKLLLLHLSHNNEIEIKKWIRVCIARFLIPFPRFSPLISNHKSTFLTYKKFAIAEEKNNEVKLGVNIFLYVPPLIFFLG